MEELKLRGYVTPEDFEGTATEKCQKALDTAEAEDIRKVVIEGAYELEQALVVPTQTEIILKAGASLAGDTVLVNKVSTEEGKASWSFEDKLIYIRAEEGACIKGNMKFYHARNVVLEDLCMEGQVAFEFCREVRMERNTIKTDKCCAVKIGRGCNNYIVQYNTFESKCAAVRIDTTWACGEYVIGKDLDNHELIFKDNKLSAEAGFKMTANETDGIFNVQIDHNTVTGKGIVIGDEEKALPKERFFNLTATDFDGATEAVVLKNEVKHCYFGE